MSDSDTDISDHEDDHQTDSDDIEFGVKFKEPLTFGDNLTDDEVVNLKNPSRHMFIECPWFSYDFWVDELNLMNISEKEMTKSKYPTFGDRIKMWRELYRVFGQFIPHKNDTCHITQKFDTSEFKLTKYKQNA